MQWAKSVITAIFLAFFVFGGYKLAIDDKVSNELKDNLVEESQQHVIWASVFVKTLDDLTPTLSYKLPFTDRKIFLINEFPLLGWVHLLTAILLIWVAGSIMRIMHTTKLKMVGVFVILIVIAYIIGSVLSYALYYTSAHKIGFVASEATQFRRQYSNNYDNVALPLIIYSLFALLNIIKITIKKIK